MKWYIDGLANEHTRRGKKGEGKWGGGQLMKLGLATVSEKVVGAVMGLNPVDDP